MGMFSSYVMYLCSQPAKGEFTVVTCLGLGLEIFYCWQHGGIGSGLGCAALLALFLNALATDGKAGQLFLQRFLSALVPPFFILLTPTFLDATVKLNPSTLDHFAYAYDRCLGGQLSFFLARLFAQVFWFEKASMFFYVTLPLAWALVYVSGLNKRGAIALRVFHSFIISAVIANIVFHLFPCGGPKNFFGTLFPNTLPVVEALVSQVMSALTPRNAVPSLHTTWVLLLWWNSRSQSLKTRTVTYLYLAFTLFATLGLGEHYLFDLIVAIPFAVSVQALCFYELPLTDNRRSRPLVVGILLFFLGLLFARFGLASVEPCSSLVWLVTLVLVLIPLYLESRLWQAAEEFGGMISPASTVVSNQ